MTARPAFAWKSPRRRAAAVAAALAMLPAAALAFKISDPLSAAPAELRVTLGLPPGFALLPGSAALRVSATNPQTQETVRSDDPLTAADPAGPEVALALADPAQAQFAALEAQVAAWRAAPLAQIDVSFTPCRSTDAADPAGPLRLAIQPAPGAPRLSLLPEGTTLAAYLGPEAAPIARCPN